VSVARQITDLMADLHVRDGLSFLFIGPDVAVFERSSHRVAEMQVGRIVETEPTAAALTNPAHRSTCRLLAAVPLPDPARRHRTWPTCRLRPQSH
jgi:ABC-type oligopeptide transport system ATPase subunit